MNPEYSSEDKALSRTLRGWKVESPLPSRFAEDVWKRIERARTPAGSEVWTALRSWIASAVRRPSLAIGYVAVLLLIGLIAGYWQGRAGSQRANEKFSAQYVQAVDPYQMPR